MGKEEARQTKVGLGRANWDSAFACAAEKKKTERGSFGATQPSYAGWSIPGHTSQSNTARMRERGGNRKITIIITMII